MPTDHLIRDVLEALIVIAVGGTLWSAVRALRRGEIRAFRCPACHRPTSRAYPRCKHCDRDWSQAPLA